MTLQSLWPDHWLSWNLIPETKDGLGICLVLSERTSLGTAQLPPRDRQWRAPAGQVGCPVILRSRKPVGVHNRNVSISASLSKRNRPGMPPGVATETCTPASAIKIQCIYMYKEKLISPGSPPSPNRPRASANSTPPPPAASAVVPGRRATMA